MSFSPLIYQTEPLGHKKIEPAYLALYRSGELLERAQEANQRLSNCDLCAQYCQVDRTKGKTGAVCHTSLLPRVFDSLSTVVEEAPLRGKRGSGSIQFAGCNLRCEYCLDWESSQSTVGHEIKVEDLAALMLSHQKQGLHNINLISPSHVVAQILDALVLACDQGFDLPLVYSSGGYDSLECLQILDGVIDIYAPHIKYGDNAFARKYSHVRNYVEYSHIALREMYRQVGDLIIDDNGVAQRGLLVRHLILPSNQASTKRVLSHISADISPNTYINLMDSYSPEYQASNHEKLNRPINESELRQAIRCGDRCGLTRLDTQLSRHWTAL